MRYKRTKQGRMYFLKPYESFCKYDGDDGYLDSNTSCRRYVRVFVTRRMKFLIMGKGIYPRFISLIRGFKRKNFPNKHYDDNRIYSNRKFWFYRVGMKNEY